MTYTRTRNATGPAGPLGLTGTTGGTGPGGPSGLIGAGITGGTGPGGPSGLIGAPNIAFYLVNDGSANGSIQQLGAGDPAPPNSQYIGSTFQAAMQNAPAARLNLGLKPATPGGTLKASPTLFGIPLPGPLGTIATGAKTADNAAAGAAGGLAGIVGTLITTPLAFLKFIAWLFHPLNWLRAIEFGTGMALTFVGLYLTLKRSRTDIGRTTARVSKRAVKRVIKL